MLLGIFNIGQLQGASSNTRTLAGSKPSYPLLPGAVWVADPDENRVTRLDSDGNRVCQFGYGPMITDSTHPEFKEPLHLAVNPQDGSVWVTCTMQDRVFKLLPNCTCDTSFASPLLFPNGIPQAPCIDANGACWLCLAGKKELVKIDPETGAIVNTIADTGLSAYEYPVAMALDIDKNWLWVVEMNQASQGHISLFDVITGNKLLMLPGFNGAWADVDQVTHCCWVADMLNNRVVKISLDGPVTSYYGFVEPICVSVDPDHAVWVADKGNDQVVRLSELGVETLRLSGFAQPRVVQADYRNGGCWVSDTGNRRLVKISSAGDTLFSVTGFTTPIGLAVDSTAVSVEEAAFVPDLHSLQITPNPATWRILVRFSLRGKSNVSLKIYGLDGRLISILANDDMNAGVHSFMWEGEDVYGNLVPGGVYFAKLVVDGCGGETRKLILVK